MEYTEEQINKLQEFSDEFSALEQNLFDQRGAMLLGEDMALDFARISAICRSLFMRIRMNQDDNF